MTNLWYVNTVGEYLAVKSNELLITCKNVGESYKKLSERIQIQKAIFHSYDILEKVKSTKTEIGSVIGKDLEWGKQTKYKAILVNLPERIKYFVS